MSLYVSTSTALACLSTSSFVCMCTCVCGCFCAEIGVQVVEIKLTITLTGHKLFMRCTTTTINIGWEHFSASMYVCVLVLVAGICMEMLCLCHGSSCFAMQLTLSGNTWVDTWSHKHIKIHTYIYTYKYACVTHNSSLFILMSANSPLFFRSVNDRYRTLSY